MKWNMEIGFSSKQRDNKVRRYDNLKAYDLMNIDIYDMNICMLSNVFHCFCYVFSKKTDRLCVGLWPPNIHRSISYCVF